MHPSSDLVMATILIADDEEGPRDQLLSALARAWPSATVVAACKHGVDAWDSFLEFEPQVCFLDIRMPGLSGLEVAKKIAATESNSQIVFCTAYGDHAVQAFDAGAIDYLMKPINQARLGVAVQRLQDRIQQLEAGLIATTGSQVIPPAALALLPQMVKPSQFRMIQASVGKEIRLIPVQEVIYFEADTRYTKVVHTGGEALIRIPLKELLVGLDADQFWQIHRSVIVNSAAIVSALRISEGTMQIALRGRKEMLAVSRHFQGLFKAQ